VPDDARLLEAPHAVERGRGGEADEPCKGDVRAVRVRLQLGEQPHIYFVKQNGHLTKYRFVSGTNCQIELGYRPIRPKMWP
jgi:hypothetical protein